MRENTTEVIIGALVLAFAGGFLAYAARSTGFSTGGSDNYDLVASFRSAEGVSLGVDVRMSGVKVGSVTALNLNPETFRADATLSLRSDIPVPTDSTAIVQTESLLGGTFVELVPGGSFDNYQAGDVILDTQGAVSIVNLLAKFAAGGSEE